MRSLRPRTRHTLLPSAAVWLGLVTSLLGLVVTGCTTTNTLVSGDAGPSADRQLADRVVLGDDERCGNGLDDDRDGEADEDCACAVGTTQDCSLIDPSIAMSCSFGTQQCIQQGEFATWGPCSQRTTSCAVDGGPAVPDAYVPDVDADLRREDAGTVSSCGGPLDEPGSDFGLCTGWVARAFMVDATLPATCNDASYVRLDPRFRLWVGVRTCAAGAVFYLSEDGSVFAPATDCAGHGQDFCELLDPGFRLPSSDDITSACADCSIGTPLNASGGPVFSRCNIGERFCPTANGSSLYGSVVNCGASRNIASCFTGDACRMRIPSTDNQYIDLNACRSEASDAQEACNSDPRCGLAGWAGSGGIQGTNTCRDGGGGGTGLRQWTCVSRSAVSSEHVIFSTL